MEELMQKIETTNCPRRDRTASEEQEGVQTFMEIKDEELVEVQPRLANLQQCGIPKGQAWQWANTRKGYWRISKSRILTCSITSERLILAGYPSILNLYIKLHHG